MAKRKVLIISTVGLIYDGITSVITSYLEAMELSGLDIRVVGTIKVEPTIRNRIESLGCIIVDLPNRRSNTFKYFNALRKYIKKERIEVVHAHGNSGTLAIELLAAKLGGAKKRIAHSHNTKCDQVRADKVLRPLFNQLYTDALACGDEAGKWLYGDRPFTVLKNGRDVEKYKFNPEMRDMMRRKYGLTDELVIGHVGGFFEQKNHKFLIEIFRKVLSKKTDSKLFMIGDGRLKSEIENLSKDIKDKVVFVGTTDHVENYLNMMDVMLLPSLFEGLPLVAIEWQINGLPCAVSDVVTRECKLCDCIEFLSIDKSIEWVKYIERLNYKYDRLHNSEIGISNAKKKGFSIDRNANDLKEIYIQ